MFQVTRCQLPVARRNRSARATFNPQLSTRNRCPGFSLVEILVVVSILSLIVLALMAVFSSTQKAFRSAVTQTDVLEGSRAAMGLMASDLRILTPSGSVNPGPVNFGVLGNYSYSAAYKPLLQNLPGGSVQRTNQLNYFFILGRQNTKWVGIGYAVDNTNDSNLYPLYRYYRDDLSVQSNPLLLFSEFANIVSGGQWTNANVSHIIDGVVHLTVHAYDPDGQWINNAHQPYVKAMNTQFFTPNYGEAQLYMYSNTVPAAVELELGVIEDSTLARAGSLPNNLPALPPNDRRSLFLNNQSGVVHLFRQRVNIPNVDPTAYQ